MKRKSKAAPKATKLPLDVGLKVLTFDYLTLLFRNLNVDLQAMYQEQRTKDQRRKPRELPRP